MLDNSASQPIEDKSAGNQLNVAALMLWSLVPIAAMWIGLYFLKSATWTFFLYHVVCLLPAIYVGRSLWLPTLNRPATKDTLILLAVAVLFSVITVLSYELNGNMVLSSEHAIKLMQDLGWSKQLFWPVSIYAIVVNPFVEEIFWRGIVLNRLEMVKSPIKHFALIWSSGVYALFHYVIFSMVMYPVWAEIGTVMLACYGALLAMIYKRTGSIVTTGLAHGLLTDLAAVALMIDLSRKFPGLLF